MSPYLIIAGPCAAESEAQIDIAIAETLKRKVDFIRINLWKPRTKPGFEGLGSAGIPLLIKAAQAGLNPGLEVIVPEQAREVMDAVLPHLPPTGKLLLWLGARNQNHFIQKEIASVAARDPRVYVMAKNQPWVGEDHWEGIVHHLLAGGISRENVLYCHRGFAPHHAHNPLGLRNVPDFDMSMRVKERTGIPVIFDPSHTGGTVPNVIMMCKQASEYAFDGMIIEVHHDPKNALTDAKQQLTWEEFDTLMEELGHNR